MNMQMPEFDALSATRCTRADPSPQSQPRTATLTANVWVESRQEAAAAGVNDDLTKPLEHSALLPFLQGSLPLSPSSTAPVPPGEAATDAATDAIDAATFSALRAAIGPENQAVLQEMIRVYLQDGETQLGSLQEALTQQDPHALFHLAHRFKGSSATFGAKGLAQLCQKMESLTRAEPIDWNLAQSLFSQLQAEYQRVALRLTAYT